MNTEIEQEILTEIEAPDHVKDMVTALSRLAAGAGKKTEAGRSFDVCTIEKDCGYSFNGVVYTRVPYSFGINATVSASLLRSILSHLIEPTIKETPKSIILKSQGKSFRLTKLPGCAFKPPTLDVSGNTTKLNGSWLRKVSTVAPTVASYNSFPGVWAGPEGYVACEQKSLGYVQADGPSTSCIIPRQLVAVLPAADLDLELISCQTETKDSQQLVKITAEGGSDWHSPPLAGRFPDWKGVLATTTDRQTTVSGKELSDALRAVTLLSKTGWIEIDNNICSVYTNTTNQAIAADGPTTAKASLETITPANKWIRLSIDLRKLLNIVEAIGAQEIELSSTEQADRLFVKTKTGLPMTFILAHRRGVQDKTHAYRDNKPN